MGAEVNNVTGKEYEYKSESFKYLSKLGGSFKLVEHLCMRDRLVVPKGSRRQYIVEKERQ